MVTLAYPRSVQKKTSSRMWNVHHHWETDCEVPCAKNIGTLDQKREGVFFPMKDMQQSQVKGFFSFRKQKNHLSVIGTSRQPYSGKVLKWKCHLYLYTPNLPQVQLNTQSRRDMLYTCLYIQGSSKYWPNSTSNTHCPVWQDFSAVS